MYSNFQFAYKGSKPEYSWKIVFSLEHYYLTSVFFFEHPWQSGRLHRTHNAVSSRTSLVQTQLDAIVVFTFSIYLFFQCFNGAPKNLGFWVEKGLPNFQFGSLLLKLKIWFVFSIRKKQRENTFLGREGRGPKNVVFCDEEPRFH